jgi:hypothetical protein
MSNGTQLCGSRAPRPAAASLTPAVYAAAQSDTMGRAGQARRSVGTGAERRLTRRLLAAWEQARDGCAVPRLRDFVNSRSHWLDEHAFLLKSDCEPAQSVFLVCSPSTTALFGDPVAGATVSATAPGWLREALLAACERCCESETPQEAEGSWGDGAESARFRAIVLPLTGEGQPAGYLLGTISHSRSGAEADAAGLARGSCAGRVPPTS